MNVQQIFALQFVLTESQTDPRDQDVATVHLASGSGRNWKCITLLVVPLPVSM